MAGPVVVESVVHEASPLHVRPVQMSARLSSVNCALLRMLASQSGARFALGKRATKRTDQLRNSEPRYPQWDVTLLRRTD